MFYCCKTHSSSGQIPEQDMGALLSVPHAENKVQMGLYDQMKVLGNSPPSSNKQ